MVGRKKLAEQTRGTRSLLSPTVSHTHTRLAEFKKVSDDEKLGMFKTLLKGKLVLQMNRTCLKPLFSVSNRDR